VSVVEPGVDMGIPKAELAKVTEHVSVNERRPALSRAIGRHAVVVDMAVVPIRKQPEADVAEHLTVFRKHP
jgi:hypothetical protein